LPAPGPRRQPRCPVRVEDLPRGRQPGPRRSTAPPRAERSTAGMAATSRAWPACRQPGRLVDHNAPRAPWAKALAAGRLRPRRGPAGKERKCVDVAPFITSRRGGNRPKGPVRRWVGNGRARPYIAQTLAFSRGPRDRSPGPGGTPPGARLARPGWRDAVEPSRPMDLSATSRAGVE
jgi:hypothetical protein